MCLWSAAAARGQHEQNNMNRNNEGSVSQGLLREDKIRYMVEGLQVVNRPVAASYSASAYKILWYPSILVFKKWIIT